MTTLIDLAPMGFTFFTDPAGQYGGVDHTDIRAINNNGEIAGDIYSVVFSPSFSVQGSGFVYTQGGFVPVNVPGSNWSEVVALNDQGQMLVVDNVGGQTYLFDGTTFTQVQVGSSSNQVIASGINDAGQIVGSYSTDGGNTFSGFIFSGGVLTTLDEPDADPTTPNTYALGINNVGQVVGDYVTDANQGVSAGFIYDSGTGTYTTVQVSPLSFGAFTSLQSINDWGQALGTYNSGHGYLGFLYAGGQAYNLGLPAGANLSFGGINNLGQVFGSYNYGPGFGNFGTQGFTILLGEHFTYNVTTIDFPGAVAASSPPPSSFGTEIRNSNIDGDFVGRYSSSTGPGFTGQSFVSVGGVMSDLTFAAAVNGVDARDINDSGKIAGNYLDGAFAQHGFVYDHGSVTTIDDPNADAGTTTIMGMNNAGQVIGTYSVGGVQHEFVWSASTGYTDLDLSGSGMRSSPILALDINDSGEIVGTWQDSGGVDHGFLLDKGQFTAIGFPGTVGSFGSGVDSINNAGQIAGFYLGQNGVQAFVYSGGVYSSVGVPGSGGAYGIANNGTVAGSTNNGSTHDGFLATISGATYVPTVVNSAIWGRSISGNFDDPNMWRSGTVPDAGSIVSITRPHSYTVTMSWDHTVNKIHIGTVNDDRATLAVHDSNLTVVGGLIDVPGTLTLDSTNGHGASLLIGANTTILGGCGCAPDIAMGLRSADGPITIGVAATTNTVGDVKLTNEAYIGGQGQIGGATMKLVNAFQIEAEQGTLTIDTGANKITNFGQLDAAPGATLNIESDVNNFGGGILSGNPGSPGSSAVNIDGAVNNQGVIGVAAGSSLDIDGALKNYAAIIAYGDMTVTGPVFNDSIGGIIVDGGSLDITGTVNNLGSMQVHDGGSLTVHGILKGAGSVIADSSTVTIDTLQGASAGIIDDGTLDFGGRSTTAVDFSGSAGGSLILEDSGDFRGSISGFDDTDMVTLKDLMIGPSTRLAYNAGTGILRVVDSGGIEAKLDFGTGYTINNFTLGHDTDGDVTITHHA